MTELTVTPQAFPLIEVSGPPAERGRQYGRQAAERIHLGAGHYTEQLERLSLTRAALEKVVNDYLPVIEKFDATYVEEMRGIAQGADISFVDVMLLNARTEILKLAASPKLRETMRLDEEDGCTGLVVLPQRSLDGTLIHAQNWDWKLECAETSVVLRIRRDDGPDILTFTEAGGLARSGMNDAGIGLTANFLESDQDFKRIGVPLPLIRRKVLEQEHLALAYRAVYATAKSGSNNMIVSHAGGVALNFECAPDETFPLQPESGLLVHANHWVSPVALTKLKDTGILSTPDTLYRDVRVRDLLLSRGDRVGIDDVKAALLDDFAKPWSVCRPPRLNLASNLSATVATVVMTPAHGRMEIVPLPALGAPFTVYGFAD